KFDRSLGGRSCTMTGQASRGRLLSAVLIVGCLAGCKGLFGSQGPPPDPLFLDRKPLEAKAVAAPPLTLAHSEPQPPANPCLATASRSRQVPGTLTNRPRQGGQEEEQEAEHE